MSIKYTSPSFSANMIVYVITLAPPDFPLPFELMVIRILRTPGVNSSP